MKKVLAVFISFIVILSICGCKGEDTPVVLDPEEIITVNLDVSLYENLLGEKFVFSLTARQKQDNFLTVDKSEDSNAVFTMKRKDYDQFKKELLSSRKDIFDIYNQKAEENGIIKVEYDSDITNIKVYVDKNVYNTEIKEYTQEYLNAYNCISGSGRNATIYHMYNLGEIKKCTVTVIDAESNTVIETRVYPDILKEN